jgi:hypothetical protein
MRTGEPLRAEMEVLDAAMYRPNNKDWPKGPWEFAIGGVTWAVATNGHVLVAVPRDLVPGECVALPEKARKLATRWIPFEPETSTAIPAGVLKTFSRLKEQGLASCGTCKNKRKVRCDECSGTGTDECSCSRCGNDHECECDECDGAGVVACPNCCDGLETRVPAEFLGQIVDLRKLAEVLRVIHPDDSESIHVSVQNLTDSQVFIGYHLRSEHPRWVAVVMPLQRDIKPETKFQMPVPAPCG